MYELSKAEWKLLQERTPSWQERYMEKLLYGYKELIENAEVPSSAFWELEEKIRVDRKHPGVLVELRKSEAVFILRTYLNEGVIDFEDLEGFSDKLKEFLKKFI